MPQFSCSAWAWPHCTAASTSEAADLYRRAIAHEPLDEAAHRALMECWAASGQSARALRHYEELSELLNDQVGGTPAAQTVALYERLRRPAG